MSRPQPSTLSEGRAGRRRDPLGELATHARSDRALAALIHRSAAADERVFASLYDITSPRVYGLAVRILGSAPWAERTTHEAYLEIWRHAPHFEVDRSSPTAWITALAHRLAVDQFRSRQSSTVERTESTTPRAGHGRGHDACFAQAREVQVALTHLPAGQRGAIERDNFRGQRPTHPEDLVRSLLTLAPAPSQHGGRET
jgi:RNA polymerase sigma-70 factor (ECF subfamily)